MLLFNHRLLAAEKFVDDKKQHLDNVNAAETAGLKRFDEKSSAHDLVNLFNLFVMFPIEIALGQIKLLDGHHLVVRSHIDPDQKRPLRTDILL